MLIARLEAIFSFFLHFDRVLGIVIQRYGAITYGLLFLIIFCETGLIIAPFLPGDSLLFAAGAFAGLGSLRIEILLPVCFVAAILGDAVNYSIGRRLGYRAFQKLEGRILTREHWEKTQRFYVKYGGRTIVIARFMPIIRTLAPFVAGVGHMPYGTFVRYNIIGAFMWTNLFLLGGYFFGTIPFVQQNFSIVIVMIVCLSLTPVIFEAVSARLEQRRAAKEK